MSETSAGDAGKTNATRIVFRGVNLIDGEHPAQPGMTVVVRGERIETVAPDAAFEPSPEDQIHDLGGLSLMPGMVQCHFHSHFGAFGDGCRVRDQLPPVALRRARRHPSGPQVSTERTMIVGDSVVRGQMPLEDFFASDAVVVAGLVAAMIAIPIALHNSGSRRPASP